MNKRYATFKPSDHQKYFIDQQNVFWCLKFNLKIKHSEKNRLILCPQ